MFKSLKQKPNMFMGCINRERCNTRFPTEMINFFKWTDRKEQTTTIMHGHLHGYLFLISHPLNLDCP